MGALKLQQRAGTIRRVVRVSGQFVCGVCRNSYEDLHAARGCLERCWQEFLDLNPVIVKKVNGLLMHRCRYCARDYEDGSRAHQCAEQCRQQLERKTAAEARVAGIEDKLPVKKPTRTPGSKRAVARVVMPTPAVRKKQALNVVPSASSPEVDKLVEDAASTITADANEKAVEPLAPAPPSADAAGADPVAGDVKKKKPSDIFYRDQAKYVCTVCHQKYFTKVEVTNCYDSHE